MFNAYINEQRFYNSKLAIKFIAFLVVFSLLTMFFAPVVHANIIGKIVVYLIITGISHKIGELVWNGAIWVADAGVKAALASSTVAVCLTMAVVAAGCTYMIATMPNDPLPGVYSPTAYWDYNNGYWVMLQSLPIDIVDERLEIQYA